MSAAKKLKNLFPNPPQRRRSSPPQKSEKEEVHLLRQKIITKIKREPQAAKKMALLIEKMLLK